MFIKVVVFDVDYVFCDLEDVVVFLVKLGVCKIIVEVFNGLDWGKIVRCVCVNDVMIEWCFEDIIEVVEGVGENLDIIMLMKLMDVGDVLFVDKLLIQFEKKFEFKKRIGLECLIEEVQVMWNVWEIVYCCDCLECLIFGMGDYVVFQGIIVKNIGGEYVYFGDIFYYFRYQLIIVCCVVGIDFVDGFFGNFKNEVVYREECCWVLMLGMVGKWVIYLF